MAPSAIFEKLRRLFPDIPVSSGSDPEDVIFTEDSAFSHLAQVLRSQASTHAGIPFLWYDLLAWYGKYRPEKESLIRRGLAAGNRDDKLNANLLAAILSVDGAGELIMTSPSSIEMYSKCPFSFLLGRAMKLRERRAFEIDSRYIGDLYHETLRRFGVAMSADGLPASDPGSNWMKADRSRTDAAVDGAFAEAVEAVAGELLARDASSPYRLARLRRIVQDVAWAIRSSVADSGTVEMHFEERFGADAPLPEISIEAGGRSVGIAGRIDRVDVDGGGQARVLDYKSGNDKFDKAAVASGWQLQLFIYLRAVSAKWAPAGVSYFRLDEPLVDISDPRKFGDPGALAGALAREYRGDGISVDEAPDVFEELRLDVDRVLGELADGLAAGEFPVRPKEKKAGAGEEGETACRYCRYGAICGYDAGY
jgi:ATP-dependent helicase/nuclease subunit B